MCSRSTTQQLNWNAKLHQHRSAQRPRVASPAASSANRPAARPSPSPLPFPPTPQQLKRCYKRRCSLSSGPHVLKRGNQAKPLILSCVSRLTSVHSLMICGNGGKAFDPMLPPTVTSKTQQRVIVCAQTTCALGGLRGAGLQVRPAVSPPLWQRPRGAPAPFPRRPLWMRATNLKSCSEALSLGRETRPGSR